ncbi:BglG family transcription antiterminator [Enterococcus sp. AZ072]|uniref:BglG family transcription antiterminator n=1 Tax=unclassified Enterococcus TaxID=2608891 RepID=UPI003D2B755B
MSKLSYQRLDELLERFIQQPNPTPMKELTAAFAVSDRTIRTDITNLNDTLKNVGAVVSLIRGKGYLLAVNNQAVFEEWWKESTDSVETSLASTEERQHYLLFTLFKATEPLNLDAFLDQLYVSKNTFYSYLKTIRDQLLPYGLKIVNRPNIGFEVVGNEFAKRQAISDLLIGKDLQEYLIGFTETELALFDNIDLSLLQELELAYLTPLDLLESDYYHKNILSHFALALSRLIDGKSISEMPVKIPQLKKNAQQLMQQFFTKLEETFESQLPQEEQDYLIYYLSVNAPRFVVSDPAIIQSESIADEIVEDLLQGIKQTSNYDWTQDAILIKDLTSHIEGFIHMNSLDAGHSNPLLETIKQSFPLAYDLCLTHLESIGTAHGLYFSEDEMGYIALHIAGALERSSMLENRKYKVILVCGTGRAMSRIIEAKINKRYQDKFEIVERLSYVELQQQPLATIDFVITTIPLDQLEIPFIYIRMGQLDKDIEKIDQFLTAFETQTSTVMDLFQEDAFHLFEGGVTKEALLKTMCVSLEEKGLVPAEFYASILAREAISQTNINQLIAIPHPMSLLANHSRLSVAIVPDGVDWGNQEKVQFVFLFAITKEDYEDTGDIYSLLLDFMARTDLQQAILSNPSFEAFLAQFKEL